MSLMTVVNASFSSERLASSISLYRSGLPKMNTANPFSMFSKSDFTRSRCSSPVEVLSTLDKKVIARHIVAIVGGSNMCAFPAKTMNYRSSHKTACAIVFAALFI